MHHGVTFNFGSAKVFSPAIFETSFSYDKDILIAATDYYVHPTGGFRSFEGKVFILSLPNLVWVFIGLIACIGMLLVKIGL